jgi:nucleotide-binding universal stress UspA family protein
LTSLVAMAMGDAGDDMYRRILIATDLLPISVPALRDGLLFAKSQGASVAVAYVIEVWMVERQWFTRVSKEDIAFHRGFLAREEEAVSREMHAQIDRVCSDQRLDIAVDTVVRHGRAADEIGAVAAQRGCDLIVIGTRGRPNTLGSVAEQVVRIAGRPVLVIPTERRTA